MERRHPGPFLPKRVQFLGEHFWDRQGGRYPFIARTAESTRLRTLYSPHGATHGERFIEQQWGHSNPETVFIALPAELQPHRSRVPFDRGEQPR
jgi:hypothetical protein